MRYYHYLELKFQPARVLRMLYLVLYVALLGCSARPAGPSTSNLVSSEPIEINILYTSEEHGWMKGTKPYRGAAELMQAWKRESQFKPEETFLRLSGGDSWTGSSLSFWFEGESMVEVMNGVGYDAATLGNHDFDFGPEGLKARATQAKFPLLAANLRNVRNESLPSELGILPFTIIEKNGLKIGVIGLAATDTRILTKRSKISQFYFVDFEESLREVLPEVTAHGAQFVVVIAHMCMTHLELFVRAIADLPVQLVAGACGERFARTIAGITMIGAGGNLESYAYAQFRLDPVTFEVQEVAAGVRLNTGIYGKDRSISQIISRWERREDADLSSVIGYSETGIKHSDMILQTLLTRAWLEEYPKADLTFNNIDSIRAPLPRGSIRKSDIVSMLPFNNSLVAIDLSEEQVFRILHSPLRISVGGIERKGKQWILSKTQEPIGMKDRYVVLVTDYLYEGGDGLELFAKYDPNGQNIKIDWREAVIRWIKNQNLDSSRPLEQQVYQEAFPQNIDLTFFKIA